MFELLERITLERPVTLSSAGKTLRTYLCNILPTDG